MMPSMNRAAPAAAPVTILGNLNMLFFLVGDGRHRGRDPFVCPYNHAFALYAVLPRRGSVMARSERKLSFTFCVTRRSRERNDAARPRSSRGRSKAAHCSP